MKTQFRPKLSFIFFLILLAASARLFPSLTAEAQTKSEKHSGAISGRLLEASGQPIANATVRLNSAGYLRPESRTVGIDEEGRFRFSDLSRGVYNVIASVPGYVLADEGTRQLTYRAGDTVNITMVKGAAVTGSVTDSAGEPMTGLSVQAVRIRDKDGHPASNNPSGYSSETDDRGVYRIFGLQSGTYLIVASGRAPFFYQVSGYQNDLPTYYPSSTRDVAQSVTVQPGAEISGIDIRFRGERGHAISGTMQAPGIDFSRNGVGLQLYNVTTRAFEATTYSVPGGGDGFAFYGVADGEYVISATTNGYSSTSTGGIGRVRTRVKGADATGITLTMVPYGSIGGLLQIDALADPPPAQCQTKRHFAAEEILVTTRREDQGDELSPSGTSMRQVGPSPKGEFLIPGLEPGGYRVGPSMLGEDYYLRSITIDTPGRPPVDAGLTPLGVKAGERLSNLKIVVAEGAAGLEGRVVPASQASPLPDRLRVHLVPAEKEAAGNVLRYAQVNARPDGSFTFTSLAPGRYFVVARPIPEDEPTLDPHPKAWDARERASLLQQASAAEIAVDLPACRRQTDYSLKFAPSAPPPRRKSTGSKTTQ